MKLPVTIHGHALQLHTSGAVFLEEYGLLLISDVHLGKVTHFRKHGIAVPAHAAGTNFLRLTATADLFAARTICFLGDLFHSGVNREWELFADWAATRREQLLLISGNHDVLSPNVYAAIGMDVRDELVLDNLLLTHAPEEREGLFTICGHVHPGVKLHGYGRQSVSLACFFETKSQMILPAFGAFTGKHFLRADTGKRVFAIAGEEILLLPSE